MKLIGKHIGVIFTIILVLGGVYIYRSFFAAPNESMVEADLTSQGVGKDVVDLYHSLESVNLDMNFFSSNSYKGFVDFTTIATPQPLGRKNPFDKI